MYNIIAIMGQAGSGKDTILQSILAKYPYNYNEIISCTTRPMREGEAEGVNYFYLTEEQFADKVIHGEMLEASLHHWYYGTSYDALRSDAVNIGVFNPEGVESLIHAQDVNVKIFYITATNKTRLLRQLNREENPNVDEIIRRYGTDKADFIDFDFDYIELINEKEDDLQKCVEAIVAQGQF